MATLTTCMALPSHVESVVADEACSSRGGYSRRRRGRGKGTGEMSVGRGGG